MLSAIKDLPFYSGTVITRYYHCLFSFSILFEKLYYNKNRFSFEISQIYLIEQNFNTLDMKKKTS